MPDPTVPRRLFCAFFALFAITLSACGDLMALGAPTDRFVIAPAAESAPSALTDDVEQSVAVLRKRLEGMGLVVHRLEPGKDGQIIIEVGGKDAKEAVATTIGIKGDLAIRLVDIDALPELVAQGIAPVGSEILPLADSGIAVAVRRVGVILGTRIVAARPGVDEFTNEPMVMISFDQAGALKLAQLSGANVGTPLAIVLDGKVLSTPIINEPITGGNAQLSGGFTQESANQLAVALQSGALPIAFKVVDHTRL